MPAVVTTSPPKRSGGEITADSFFKWLFLVHTLIPGTVVVLLVLNYHALLSSLTTSPPPPAADVVIDDDLPFMEETTVLHQHITARYPARRFGQLRQRAVPTPLVVGVLSDAHKVKQRQAIRETWAHGHTNVFFLVAGPWEHVAEEFVAYEDLVWLDHRDEYFQTTKSVLGFIHLVHTKIKRFGHLFKTDDDSYMRLEEVEHLSMTRYAEVDYMGKCVRKKDAHFFLDGIYPDYAARFAYQISYSFAACISRSVTAFSAFSIEHGTIGVFAQHCQVPCVTVEDFYEHEFPGYVPPNTMLVQHQAHTPEYMASFHRVACSNKNFRNVNCAKVLANVAEETNSTAAVVVYVTGYA